MHVLRNSCCFFRFIPFHLSCIYIPCKLGFMVIVICYYLWANHLYLYASVLQIVHAPRYVSHTFYPFNSIICKLWVWILWYILLLCMFWLVFDYLNEIECMLYFTLYCQTNFDVFMKAFWVASGLHLKYTSIFLSLMINFFGMFVRI